MNELALTNDILDHELLSPVAHLSPAADELLDATDEAFAAADETLSTDEKYPMVDLIDRLRARYNWSWDIVDVLTDEQLQLLAFSVEDERR